MKELVNSVADNGDDLSRQLDDVEGIGAVKTTFKNIDEGLNFAATSAKRMEDPDRFVPIQTLRNVIKSTKGVADPRGSNAMMYYTTITKNGQTYNLEVLYDKATNTVYHFEYTKKAIGNLPAIPK